MLNKPAQSMTLEEARAITAAVVPEAALENWMSLEEACATIRMSRFTIPKMINEKILDKMKHGNRTLISRASVARWMKRFQPGQQTAAKSTRRRK